jgi:hypothetical protein
LTIPLIHDYEMARLSVAQGPCSAVLPTVHGCQYAFQKSPFFCVTLYLSQANLLEYVRNLQQGCHSILCCCHKSTGISPTASRNDGVRGLSFPLYLHRLSTSTCP